MLQSDGGRDVRLGRAVQPRPAHGVRVGQPHDLHRQLTHPPLPDVLPEQQRQHALRRPVPHPRHGRPVLLHRPAARSPVPQRPGHMFNIINLKAPEYLRTNVEMVHRRYPTRASNLACVFPRVKGSGQT